MAREIDATTLRSGRLTLSETVGQSIANIGPTLTPAINVTIVVGLAGVGAWLAFAVATVGMVFVALSVANLARRHPFAGAYFVAIGRHLGPAAGTVAGWSMAAAYLCTAAATLLSADIFLPDMLAIAGLHDLLPPPGVTVAAVALLVLVCAWRDIRLSSRLALVLEAVSIALILAITVLVVVRHGTLVDRAQLTPAAMAPARIVPALTFAVFSFVGFESAAALAREARDPARAVPLAVIGSAAASGVFFTLVCYCMVLAVGDHTAVIGDSASPFAAVTRRAGIVWAAELVYLSALISSFACTLACVNAGARMIFSMGRYGVLHGALGRVHARHATPHVAATAVTIAGAALAIGLERFRTPVAALGDTGTLATFGFVAVYLMLCIAAPLDLRAAGECRARHVVVGAIGAALMGFVIVSSLDPWPAWPENLLPIVFAAFLALAALSYVVLTWRVPGAAQRILEDMEA